jgi:hypothetical protein
MGLSLGTIIELLLAILLLLTICYCVMLNERLKRFRADEQLMRATISELVTATEIAERAILSLKATAGEADRALGARLKDAEYVANDLSRLMEAAERLKLPVAPTPEPLRSRSAPIVQAAPPEPPQRTVAASPPPASAKPFRPGLTARPTFATRRG